MSCSRSALAVLAACLLAAPAFAENCKPLALITSLPTTPDAAGGFTVTASLDGHDMRLLIDTGGVYNLINDSEVTAANIARKPINSRLGLKMGATGEKLKSMIVVRDFKLGNIVADNMPFVILPDGLVAPGVDGTVGPTVIASYEFEIDPAHSKVNLFSPDHCPGQVVYWTRTPYVAIPMTVDRNLHISIPVTLDGHALNAQIDTGSSTSWMSYDDAQQMFGLDESGAKNDSDESDSQPHDWYQYPFQSLSLDGVAVHNPKIRLKKHGHLGGPPTLVIGMDVLSKLRTFISYSDHTLYITGANAPPPDQPAPGH